MSVGDRPSARVAMRRGVATATAIALAAGLLSACTTSPADSEAPSTDLAAVLPDLGIAEIERIDDPWPDEAIAVVTAYQLDVLAGEVAQGGGVLGSEIDDLVPAPADGVPFSFVVAAWLDLAQTDRARAAVAMVPTPHRWDLAPSLTFPRAALLLFTVDNMEAATRDLPEPVAPAVLDASRSGGPTVVSAAVRAPTIELPQAPCTAISTAYTKLIDTFFTGIRIPPDFLGRGGVLGVISGFLAALFNHAVSLAKALVREVIARLTAPVLQWIGEAVAIVGLASHFSSYLLGVRLIVTPSENPLRLDGRGGTWTARVDPDSRPYEPQLRDCLAALGQPPLPEIIRAGERIDWSAVDPIADTGQPYAEEVLAYDSLTTTVVRGQDAVLPWRSIPEADPGTIEHLGVVQVRLELPRAEITRLLELSRKVLSDAIGHFTKHVPIIGDAVAQAIEEVLQPMLDGVERRILRAGPSALLVRGAGQMPFIYTDPPTPTARPEPTHDRSCYTGTWAYRRAVGPNGFEHGWRWSEFTATIGETGRLTMRALGMVSGSGRPGDSLVIAFNYIGSGRLAITPDPATPGAFTVVPPIARNGAALTATTDDDIVAIVGGGVEVEDAGWGRGLIGLAMQPARLECLADGDLRITTVPSDQGTSLTWIGRRI